APFPAVSTAPELETAGTGEPLNVLRDVSATAAAARLWWSPSARGQKRRLVHGAIGEALAHEVARVGDGDARYTVARVGRRKLRVGDVTARHQFCARLFQSRVVLLQIELRLVRETRGEFA